MVGFTLLLIFMSCWRIDVERVVALAEEGTNDFQTGGSGSSWDRNGSMAPFMSID
jgi:hypothetical protein